MPPNHPSAAVLAQRMEDENAQRQDARLVDIVVSAAILFLCCFAVCGAYLRRRALMSKRSLLLAEHRSGKLRSVAFEAEMDVWLAGATAPVRLADHFEKVAATQAEKREAARSGGGVEEEDPSTQSAKFLTELTELVTGEPKDAALGVMHYMKVPNAQAHLLEMGRGLAAIRAEFDRLLARANSQLLAIATEGDAAQRAALEAYKDAEEAYECMRYVLDCEEGSSPKLFPNSRFPRDCDEKGVRADRMVTLDGDGGVSHARAMRLGDFCASVEATEAKLDVPHVAACRLYTTAAFKQINQPLRDQGRSEPHPLPITVSFLTAAIGKLRVLGANKSDARSALDLWRGLKDVTVPDSFMQLGGTELAPMSTTASLAVALQYSAQQQQQQQLQYSALPSGKGVPAVHSGGDPGGEALLFKCRTDSFMSRGASIEFLSAFPGEAEVLFPPLSYLNPSGKQATLRVGARSVRVVEVVPHFGSA